MSIPSWLVWIFAVPAGVVIFWFVVLGLCFWWAFLQRNR